MTKPLTALVIGAGDRGDAWAKWAKESDSGIEIKAIAESNTQRRDEYTKKNNIPQDAAYETGDIALVEHNNYDAVIIATPDKTHRDLAVQALYYGYNVLLEKPMATNKQDCRDIVEAQKNSGKVLSIAHVLRYSPFFGFIKELSSNSSLGKLKEIDLTEEVGYWHFAHSYVR
ncbi:MAG TPA: Gfo/Idh/MocA family oxidoreductase, partial [Candidatus Nanoarchaeia archaeon]|nr:Gfo/Idh/MocA family oxidoreductase [Candidatus Nanoarchaeia archaeon]